LVLHHKGENAVRFVFKSVVLILLLKIISAILLFIFAILFNWETEYESNLTNLSYFTSLVTVTLIVPVLETFIFQFIVVRVCKIYNIKKNIVILISASLFGLSHYYNLIYVLQAAVIGYFLTYFYIQLLDDNKPAFRLVCLIHGFVNLVLWLCQILLKYYFKIL